MPQAEGLVECDRKVMEKRKGQWLVSAGNQSWGRTMLGRAAAVSLAIKRTLDRFKYLLLEIWLLETKIQSCNHIILNQSQVGRSLTARAPAPQWEQWELELAQQQHPSTLLSQRLEVSRGSPPRRSAWRNGGARAPPSRRLPGKRVERVSSRANPWSRRDDGTHAFVTEEENLELTTITKEQSGTYECIASNDISSPDVRTVQVTVNYPPFISNSRSTGTPVGKKGVLQCEASAVPRADFEWYKEDRRLFHGLNGVKIENQGKQSMLVFFNVSEEDYGNYTCVAMNTMGITNASIILYGPSAIHDVNGYAVLPGRSVCLLLTVTLLHLLKF
ncbi:unnamed protein product [Pleuronectes platessa]|uniref:Ig-like domain-containing protein n=1 Tax=Pleuronectes platessa TaxID=8262 RepID=A0A9N7YBI8_PLEPL|nr:unnamed protein product [Pleuronectes platessa]